MVLSVFWLNEFCLSIWYLRIPFWASVNLLICFKSTKFSIRKRNINNSIAIHHRKMLQIGVLSTFYNPSYYLHIFSCNQFVLKLQLIYLFQIYSKLESSIFRVWTLLPSQFTEITGIGKTKNEIYRRFQLIIGVNTHIKSETKFDILIDFHSCTQKRSNTNFNLFN